MSASSLADSFSICRDSLPAASWRGDDGLPPLVPYGAETELFRQGSPVRYVYFIESGLVKLTYLGPEGREIIVSLRYPGWLLGAAAAMVAQTNPLTASTLTRSELRPIPVQNFIHRVRTD